jgi:hypothetical protein
MSENAKALLGGFIVLTAFATLFIWITAGVPDNPIIWGFRIGLPIVLFFAIVLALYDGFRRDRAPDFVRRHFGKRFERDGVCFVVQPSTSNGTFVLNIIFQNQYSSPCQFHLIRFPKFTRAHFHRIAHDSSWA